MRLENIPIRIPSQRQSPAAGTDANHVLASAVAPLQQQNEAGASNIWNVPKSETSLNQQASFFETVSKELRKRGYTERDTAPISSNKSGETPPDLIIGHERRDGTLIGDEDPEATLRPGGMMKCI